MLKIIAMSLAAFLPVTLYQISKLNYQINESIKITACLFIGLVWLFVENNIYFSGIITVGSYVMLRLK